MSPEEKQKNPQISKDTHGKYDSIIFIQIKGTSRRQREHKMHKPELIHFVALFGYCLDTIHLKVLWWYIKH